MSRRMWRTCCPPRSPARGSPRSARTSGRAPEVELVATHARDVARDAQRLIDGVKEGAGKAWFAHRLAAEPGADRDARPRPLRRAAARRGDRTGARRSGDRVGQGAARPVPGADPQHGRRDARRIHASAGADDVARGRHGPVARQRAGGDEGREGRRPAARGGPRVLRPGRHVPGRPQRLGAGRGRRGARPATGSSPGTGTRAARRRPRSGSPTRTTRTPGHRCSPTSSSCPAARDGSLGASIVDPHGDHLADARAKLRALAAFAEQFGDRFVRIESIAKVDDGSLRVLDLGDPTVRADGPRLRGRQGDRALPVGALAPVPVEPAQCVAPIRYPLL